MSNTARKTLPLALSLAGILAGYSAQTLAKEQPRQWTALSVFSDGRLSIQENIGSEAVCRQALCLIKDRMTCEEKADADRKEQERRKIADAAAEKEKEEFRVTHPCQIQMETTSPGLKKKPITHCALPYGGEEAFDENGQFLWRTYGSLAIPGFAVNSGTNSNIVAKQFCFREEPK